MLKKRIMTACVLLAFLLPALFAANVLPFLVLTLALVSAGAWELGRLTYPNTQISWLIAFVCAIASIFAMHCSIWNAPFLHTVGFWSRAISIWILASIGIIYVGPLSFKPWHAFVVLALGLAALACAWLALALIKPANLPLLLSSLSLVWAADIGAYAAGRLWGRHKLAPHISPGKTWEGVAGGVVTVALIGLFWTYLQQHFAPLAAPNIYELSFEKLGTLGGIAFLAINIALAICGDLIESWLKRSMGVKDSSQLLPGHGGVLDRIDALLPSLPLAAALLVC